MDTPQDSERLSSILHGLTEHVERIHSDIMADDEKSAWHELARLNAYLTHELTK